LVNRMGLENGLHTHCFRYLKILKINGINKKNCPKITFRTASLYFIIFN